MRLSKWGYKSTAAEEKRRTAEIGIYGIFRVLILWAMRIPNRKSVPVIPMKEKRK